MMAFLKQPFRQMLRIVGLGVLFGACLPCAGSQDLLHQGTTGVRAVDSDNAVLWSARGYSFGLWRLRVVDGETTWLPMSMPADLAKLLHTQRAAATNPPVNDSGGETSDTPDVEVQGGAVKLLWFEDVPQTQAEFERHGDMPYVLVQASSSDYGNSWEVTRSTARGNPMMESVREYVALDGNNAWLLAESEPGAGQLPEALFTTSDGGSTWKMMAAHGMPIGSNGGQVLSVKDARHAWFVSQCWGCDDDKMLNAAFTEDGGHNWHSAPISLAYPGCKHCLTEDIALSALADCFEVGLEPEGEQHVPEQPIHFCSADGGHTWQEPAVGLAGVPTGAVHPNVASYRGLRMLRDGDDHALGVGASCKETVRLVESDPPWPCTVMETQDGGHSWRAVLPQMTARHVQGVKELVAAGGTDWLLLSMFDDSTVLLQSTDKGGSWREVKLPAPYVARSEFK